MKLSKVLGVVTLIGGGVAAFKISEKAKELKASYDKFIFFSGDEQIIQSFEGDVIAILCSGSKIDLSEAKMLGEAATLKIYGRLCGVEIIVPAQWNVKVEAISEACGENINVKYDADDEESKFLLIQYDLKYAGIQIREA